MREVVDDMRKWLEGDTQVEMGSKEKPFLWGIKGGNVTGDLGCGSGELRSCAPPFLSGG